LVWPNACDTDYFFGIGIIMGPEDGVRTVRHLHNAKALKR